MCRCIVIINTVSFIFVFFQLRNRLNAQHEELLKAQQRSLLVRHQHKDAVIQNTSDLQQSTALSPVFTAEIPETQITSVKNSRSEAPFDKNMSSISETPIASNSGSSQAPKSNVCEPLILKPKASVHRSFSSASSFGHRMMSDGYSSHSVGQHIELQSQPSPHDPSVVKNSSQVDFVIKSTTGHSCVSSPLRSSGCQSAMSLGMQSGVPLGYMPPLTVSVTDSYVPLSSSQSKSSHYFGRLDVSTPCGSMTSDVSTDTGCEVGTTRLPVQTLSSNSSLLRKPSCVFASKSVIANTYLSRQPPVFSSVCMGTCADSVDGKSIASSCTGSSITQLCHSTTACTAESAVISTTASACSKRSLTTVSSVTTVSNQIVPFRMSRAEGQSLLHSSLSVNPLVSQTVVMGRSAGASLTSRSSIQPLLTDVVVSSNSLPVVVTCSSAFVPFHKPEVLGSTNFSAEFLSDIFVDGASERQRSSSVAEVIYSSCVTADALSQVPPSLAARSPLSAASLPSSDATDSVIGSASSEISSVSESVRLRTQPTGKLPRNLLPSTVPFVCMLTISTHIPVSSPVTDTVATSLQTMLSTVVNNTLMIAATSSSSAPVQSCPATPALDSALPLSSSHVVPSSAYALPLSDVFDKLVDKDQDIETELGAALLLCTSSPRMTRRRLSADGTHASRDSTHASHVFSLPHAAVQKHRCDLSEQTNVAAVVDKTVEEHASVDIASVSDEAVEEFASATNETSEEKAVEEQQAFDTQKSIVDSVTTESSEMETEAVSDDALSDIMPLEGEPDPLPVVQTLPTKRKQKDGLKTLHRVSFSPLALLLDASLEGDLELLMNTAKKVDQLCF